MELIYAGRKYVGNRADVFLKLRDNENLSYEQIGKLPEVKLSRQRVHKIMQQEHNVEGYLEFPELENLETFKKYTDNELSTMFKISEYKIRKARLEIGFKRSKKETKLPLRRDWLCHYLFGDNYIPGNNFNHFLYSKISKLYPKQKELLEKYYILGEPYDSATERSYNTKARAELKRIINGVNYQKLIKEEVIESKI